MHCISFNGDPASKEKLLARVRTREQAGDPGKDSLVRRAIDRLAYRSEAGIPQALASVEDCLRSELTREEAREWPEKFYSSIPVGADLSGVWPQFAAWLMDDPLAGVKRFAHCARDQAAIDTVASLYREHCIDRRTWATAKEALDLAIDAASGASHGNMNGGDLTAVTAALISARGAADASDSTFDPMAAFSVWAAMLAATLAAGDSTVGASRTRFARMCADKLLELIKAAPVVD